MIVINLKNYKIGADALELIKKIEIYYNKAIVAVPPVDLASAVKSTTLQIYSQHVDFYESGRGTGFIIPEALLKAGVAGSLVNHSEHRLKLSDIKKTLKRCNEVGLKLIICSSSIKEVQQLKKLNPWAIAFEDKKLVATGKSITQFKTHDIKRFVDVLKETEIIPLCGAGISSGEDVADALVLGCKGVLVSSAIANSPNPEKFLKEISGLF